MATEDTTMAEKLKKLGTELAAVAEDKVAREAKVKEVEQLLGSVQIKDFPELADSPIIQQFLSLLNPSDLRPGEVKNKGTLAQIERDWSIYDIAVLVREGKMPLVRFTPNESLPLIFNGVEMNVIAGEECELPRCFYDIYMERQKAMKQARIHESYLLGKSETPPHPNWDSVEGAVVRAWSTQGRSHGKISGILGTGKILTEGE